MKCWKYERSCRCCFIMFSWPVSRCSSTYKTWHVAPSAGISLILYTHFIQWLQSQFSYKLLSPSVCLRLWGSGLFGCTWSCSTSSKIHFHQMFTIYNFVILIVQTVILLSACSVHTAAICPSWKRDPSLLRVFSYLNRRSKSWWCCTLYRL